MFVLQFEAKLRKNKVFTDASYKKINLNIFYLKSAYYELKSYYTMNVTVFISILGFILSILGISLVFFIYPFTLLVLSLICKQKPKKATNHWLNNYQPKVSLVVAFYNAEKIIEKKIKNSLDLHYPKQKLEIIFSSDGSTDRSEKIVQQYTKDGIKLITSNTHQGKAYALNAAVQHSCGEILLFSDADAILDSEAINHLIKHYRQPDIGGICGQRVVDKEKNSLKIAQFQYIKLDSWIKIMETKIGSITSNDGKLYSIRKKLFQPIDEAVTDDLYTCLGVITQGYRFIFEPKAKAYIPTPSRSPKHEIMRRRRIVARSLRGIYLRREVLNPFKYGFYSVGLFINKVLRRMLPVFLICLLVSSCILSCFYSLIQYLLFAQVIIYGPALIYPLLAFSPSKNKLTIILSKVSSVAFYFCIGNLGTLLGLFDFLRGEKIAKWQPIKD